MSSAAGVPPAWHTITAWLASNTPHSYDLLRPAEPVPELAGLTATTWFGLHGGAGRDMSCAALGGMVPLSWAEGIERSQHLDRREHARIGRAFPAARRPAPVAEQAYQFAFIDLDGATERVVVAQPDLSNAAVLATRVEWPDLPAFLRSCLQCLQGQLLLGRTCRADNGWLEWRNSDRIYATELPPLAPDSPDRITRGPGTVEYNLLLLAVIDADGHNDGPPPTAYLTDTPISNSTPGWLLLRPGADHPVLATATAHRTAPSAPTPRPGDTASATLRVPPGGGLAFWSLISGQESPVLRIDGNLTVSVRATGRHKPDGEDSLETWDLHVWPTQA